MYISSTKQVRDIIINDFKDILPLIKIRDLKSTSMIEYIIRKLPT